LAIYIESSNSGKVKGQLSAMDKQYNKCYNIFAMTKSKKIILIIIIVLGILIISCFSYFFLGQAPKAEQMTFGVSFSIHRAERLGLNWREAYLAILDELGVQNLRLGAYWDRIESEEGNFNFEDLDWQIEEAGKRGVKVILAVGRKLPGWPECFEPDWAKKLGLKEQEEKILNMLTRAIERYKENQTIQVWQVENEPLFPYFGICPKPNRKFLDKEIALVKSLDSRPIIITDSGELSFWLASAKRAEIFGTTLYQVVHNRYLGYIHHIFPPVFYWRKANLIKKLFGVEKVIISELQAEPWAGDKDLAKMSDEEQAKSMDLEQFKKNINFARRTGFSEAYLWGAEWWYWRKLQGDSSIWDEAKKLFLD
jgi:hypothetical protein